MQQEISFSLYRGICVTTLKTAQCVTDSAFPRWPCAALLKGLLQGPTDWTALMQRMFKSLIGVSGTCCMLVHYHSSSPSQYFCGVQTKFNATTSSCRTLNISIREWRLESLDWLTLRLSGPTVVCWPWAILKLFHDKLHVLPRDFDLTKNLMNNFQWNFSIMEYHNLIFCKLIQTYFRIKSVMPCFIHYLPPTGQKLPLER